ncbi:hypothetical protein B0H15DRAFT_1020826 [Mycena belliarum]|uniref:Fe2OG dioxygenase domain-containing protein n=1 Tax=Mycena belliarum TaxID=1033014 RepID=A0AAD6UAK9_9AGAR|nr:hypothetical protein B0H15DRAFT_1020826 [Mycena belliae]
MPSRPELYLPPEGLRFLRPYPFGRTLLYTKSVPPDPLPTFEPSSGPTTLYTITDHLRVLRQALTEHVPYTGGVHPVKPETLAVYYDTRDRNARVIDLGNAVEEHLDGLAAACKPAPFGVDQEDILDETYRKAGQLDLTEFATRIDVVASGLLDAIIPDILEGQNSASDKVLRAEMYTLNVYGSGSFFKAHKDTPRGEDMIGSLVLVFPTAHTGGELTLSHGGNTWTFDSAAELAARTPASTPAVAYVAFYSDVTHAVEPVRSGHRVSITYNLFLVDRPLPCTLAPAGGHRTAPVQERTVEATLRALLADATFLPEGGLLAFGLAHQYPMPAPPRFTWVEGKRVLDTSTSMVEPVLQLLKGSDARIRSAAEAAGLETRVRLLYNSGENASGGGNDVLVDHVLNMEEVNEEYDMSVKDEIEKGGLILDRGAERAEYLKAKGLDRRWFQKHEPKGGVPVHWVTQITEANRVGTSYVAFGNSASLKHVYGNAALFLSVPAMGTGVRAAPRPA